MGATEGEASPPPGDQRSWIEGQKDWLAVPALTKLCKRKGGILLLQLQMQSQNPPSYQNI